MKKTIIVFLLSLMMGSAFAADNVRIVPYGERPIAYGSLKDVSDGQMFMIPKAPRAWFLNGIKTTPNLKTLLQGWICMRELKLKLLTAPFEERCSSLHTSMSRCSKCKQLLPVNSESRI